MSDDEYYDDDQYLDFDDDPFNEAEDLAAHTVQSPVLVNYDPSWETASFASDWEEYYSDEYWELEPSRKRKPKGDCIGDVEATVSTENVKKKRRKGKSSGIPNLSLGEPSLAGSTVVWKPKKQTLESYEGPIFQDGQGEKVALLTDWRERFGVPNTNGPKARQRKGKQEAEAVNAGDLSPKKYHENVLPAPPTTLEELKGLPSRSRAILTPLRELLETNGTAAFPSFDEGSGLNEDVSEPNDVVRSYGSQRVLAVEIPNQDAIMAPRPRGDRGRPRKEKHHDLMDGNGSEGDLEAHVEIAALHGKRKAEKESSSDNTTKVPTRNAKQGKPKKRRTSTSREQSQLGLSAGTAPPQRKGKKGKPRKQTPSPLHKDITRSDVGTRAAPIGKKKANGTVHNGLASTREKRKVSDSEDELSLPPPKRQHHTKNDAKAPAVASTKVAVARRSMRKK